MRTDEKVIGTIMAFFIIASVIWGIWYGFFWWTNCAFTNLLTQPGLCHIGRK